MGARRKTVFLKVRKTEVWIVSKKARPRFSLLKSERGRACSSCLWFPELSRMASKNGKGPIQRTVNSEVQIVFTGRVSTTRAIRSMFQLLPGWTTLMGDGRARLATSAQKCFPNMDSTCKARSAMSPGRQQWSRRRAWRSMKRVSMKTISGRKSLQAIKNHRCAYGADD